MTRFRSSGSSHRPGGWSAPGSVPPFSLADRTTVGGFSHDAEINGNRFGQINPDGVILAEWDVPTPISLPRGVTTGPDGNIWFTEGAGNKIGRLAP